MIQSHSENIPLVRGAELVGKTDKVLFLDVRTPAEFSAVHILGSISHPLTSLEPAQVQKLLEAKERCVVVCRSGNRARKAAEILSSLNPKPEVLDGGIAAWEASGLPVVKGKGVISLERQVRIAAGLLVVAGVALGTLVNPLWYGLGAFVGAGLVFAGVTDTCGMAMMLARMPWNNSQSSAPSCSIK
jgi:rhodanese-related sulfurtransferase